MQLSETFYNFQQYVSSRLQLHLQKNDTRISAESLPEIDVTVFTGRVLNHHETIILLTALAAHVQPALFDNAIQQYLPKGGELPEFGGVKGTNTRYMLPTGDTAMFLLAGNDVQKRQQVLNYFSTAHWFFKEQICWLEQVKVGEPRLSGKLILQQEYVELLTTGVVTALAFGPDFPAKQATTKMEWRDLMINPTTTQQIIDIKTWLQHNNTLIQDWQMGKRVKEGYRALFYGPSGTGKTLAATLLGKQFNRDVYRIDLSQVVSKYIGETEKNLEKIFTKAANKEWILFFDEADALFGKRSNVQSAHDKYANQEVSYLLQRIEDFPGLIILASNFKNNIDQAFVRRFNAIIHFAMPTATERLHIWQTAIPAACNLEQGLDLQLLAAKYELTGAAIVSVIHYAALQTVSRKATTLQTADMLNGIRKEYEKEDRVFTG